MAGQSKIKLLLVFCAWLFMFSTCYLFTFVSAASSSDVAGQWQGTWYETGYSGNIWSTIYQNGSTLSGAFTVSTFDCGLMQNVPLTGSIVNQTAYMTGSAYCPAYNQIYTFTMGGALITSNSMSGYFTACLGNLCGTGTFNMIAQTVNLVVSIPEPLYGTVSIAPQGFVCSSSICNFSIITGQEVTLMANPTSGSLFTGWGGSCGSCSYQNPCSIMMVTNENCSASFSCFSPSSSFSTVGPSGGSRSINITAGGSCSWSAVSNASWITINSGSSGAGNTTLQFTVAPNSGGVRSGTITFADRTITVIQGTTSILAKIGVFWNGSWYLDSNNTGAWEGAGQDTVFGDFGKGLPNAIPVVGDWDNTGIMRVGVYSDGTWYFDMNNNGQWDGPVTDRVYPNFGKGLTGAIPVVGDWDGTGVTRIGIYWNGLWYLDKSGDGAWNGTLTDIYYANFGVGLTGAWPVVIK